MYSGLINLHIMPHLETEDLLVNERNSFRPDRSCLDHVYVVLSIIHNRANQEVSTFAAFVDCEKSFDWVHRDLLFYKISCQYGIRGRMYDAIMSLYIQPTARVKLSNNFTDLVYITSGGKQGDNMSPTLFSVYLNDLAVEIRD